MANSLDLYLPLLEIEAETIQGMTADLPVLTMTGTLSVRSGEMAERLPGLTLAATGKQGVVGRANLNIPALSISASGLVGQVGSVILALPVLTITSSGWPIGVGVVSQDLPVFSINARGGVAPVTFTVIVMNPKNRAVTEYTNFNFNSYARLGDVILAASSSGISMLGGDKDVSSAIAASLENGALYVGASKARDIWLSGRSGGSMKVTIRADEGTSNQAMVSYLLDSLNEDRAKVPRGMKPTYLQVGVQNVSGCDFDLDAIQVISEMLRRKKR